MSTSSLNDDDDDILFVNIFRPLQHCILSSTQVLIHELVGNIVIVLCLIVCVVDLHVCNLVVRRGRGWSLFVCVLQV